MTYDHIATDLRRAELDHEIAALRTERLLAVTARTPPWTSRIRRRVGEALIVTGTALVGRERPSLRTHRA
jgi:hypothetical protein